MTKLINLLITVPLSLFVLLFAVSNTQKIDVFLNFFGLELTLPMYVISLGMMAVGFLVGCFLVWMNLYGYRIKYWSVSRKNTKLENEIDQLKADLDKAENEAEVITPQTPGLIKLSSSEETDGTPYYDR
tara:strand:+ start:323 stop:709 length:387 start_codon:yes stop_codon:yes gene_type:complete